MSVPTNPFPALGVGLAQFNSEAIYREAIRQFEALVAAHETTESQFQAPNAQNEEPDSTHSLTYVDLPAYYRNQFHLATKDLSTEEKTRLLMLCFAYKTKAGVLAYLELLDSEPPLPFVRRFRRIVEDHGRDSAFRDEDVEGVVIDENENENENENGEAGDGEGESTAQRDPDSGFRCQTRQSIRLGGGRQVRPQSDTRRSRNPDGGLDKQPVVLVEPAFPQHTTPEQTSPRKLSSDAHSPSFIIPTLPLAFPSLFFQILASTSPLPTLTAPALLSHPAACLLALSPGLKASLLATGVASCAEPSSPRRHDAPIEKARWTNFFAHILGDAAVLRTPNPNRAALISARAGYGRTDLEIWCAMWRGERQSVGLRERGRELRGGNRMGDGGGGGEGRKRKREREMVVKFEDGMGEGKKGRV
ncbi:hypothetical protein B0J11DRAFT_508882 [Dendryphion nanum]|uniref:Uncharacterized protein n=1 Tax=Dendryphion nanum TaxID=256645 RepID=A0A9P9DH16_9PLEO|nr:hypothetical protein B0J11DRAFT_508882 [Dendryphion nanum]